MAKKDLFGDEQKDSGSDFASMFETSLQSVGKTLKVGDRIKGEILTLGKEELFVSTGTIDDGRILRTDLMDYPPAADWKVGDKVDLFVTQVRKGQIFLSPKPTSKNMAEDLEDAFDMELPVEGKVTEVVNGGFRVAFGAVTAFCPISQMDARRIEQPEEYLNKKFEFRITQFDKRGRNIVVSRRKLLDEQKDLAQVGFQEDFKAGDVVDGEIRRVEKFGAFVEVAPGIEGLAHISELSWTRVSDPADVVAVGQKVRAKILKLEDEGGRLKISLSIKQVDEKPDTWGEIPKKYPEGRIVQGVIFRKEAYGVFVKFADDVTGLLPKQATFDNPQFSFDKAKVGDQVVVEIAELKLNDQRISLRMPADPEAGEWKDFSAGAQGAPGASKSIGTLGDQFKSLFETKTKKT